jgi:hypothetical protein
MKAGVKVGGVAARYIGAFVVALSVVWVRLLLTSGVDGQSSSGMQAFGDALRRRIWRGRPGAHRRCAVLSQTLSAVLVMSG